MATVHPHKGYLNTEFHFFAKGKENLIYKIYSSDKNETAPIMKGSFSPNIPYAITIKEPGAFCIVFNDGTSSEIFVEDGYKFGGSSYKDSFIYDETPWCFIIMNDRTYFYNRETEETYVEPISPDKITIISQDYVLFENTEHEERTVYSLLDQKPILNISNIIIFNDEIIVWQENSKDDIINLRIYSLCERIVKKSISTTQFIVDPNKNCIIYTLQDSIHIQNLRLPLAEECPIHICGKLAALVSPNLIISTIESYYYHEICIFDTRKGKTISHIDIESAIAIESINSATFLNSTERINQLQSFDFSLIRCKEASIKATYLSLDFYPTEWDVFYIAKEHTYEKWTHKSKNKYSYKVKSIFSNDEFGFNSDIDRNAVISSDHSICFSNYDECLIFGKDFHSVYSSNTKTFRHGKSIISQIDNVYFVLDNTIGWKPLNIEQCSFQYFNEFGIIKDQNNGVYTDLFGHTFLGCPCIWHKPFKHLAINENIILQNGRIIRHLHNLANLNLSISPSGNLGLILDENGINLLVIDNNITRKSILSDIYDGSSYKSVLLSEDGSKIMYRDHKQAKVIDVHCKQTDCYDNVSYIEDINGIRPLFSHRASSLQPCLVNPVTGQKLSSNRMTDYQFVSPNGLLYADTEIDKYVETWDLIRHKILSESEIRNLEERLSINTGTDTSKDEINRRCFIAQNISFFKKVYVDTNGQDFSNKEVIESLLHLPYNSFAEYFIEQRGVVYIRNKSTNSVFAKIELGIPLWFLNYVSFSYDNKYVAIAGRYPNNSNYGGLFLVYDLINRREVFARKGSWAVWLTSFNKLDQVAAYSSEPVSYDVDLLSEDDNVIVHSNAGYSFLTFSPNGELAALSKQGYISKYDNNGNQRKEWGHMPSCEVFIVKSSKMNLPLKKYSDLSNAGIEGASIPKTVTSVSFSNDNRRLMMVGKDGVVIIRNLHLDNYANE